jgi:hypothetical protein
MVWRLRGFRTTGLSSLKLNSFRKMITRPGATILSRLGVTHMARDLKTEGSLVAKIAGVGHEACLQGLFGFLLLTWGEQGVAQLPL